ncbi:hypothetical protein DFH27DRAFT_511420 [Peziza echinospora]|nr:hypothetical protein DFH27DRAFT_511420 [Peziza echinospora]
MADDNATTSLQPFILLAKGAGPAAAADIIVRATEHPSCFVFSELLEVPNIQRLRENEEYVKYYNLLRLFSYGTYPPPPTPPLPPLSPAQLHKLKQLTLITLSPTPNALTYPTLLTTLSIPTIRQLEDLVISAIYSSLLSAKLDTLHQRVEVSSTSGRDVDPETEIPLMVGTLRNWEARCEETLAEIEEQVEGVKREAREGRRRREEYEREVREKREALVSTSGGGGGGAGGKKSGGGGGGGGDVGGPLQFSGGQGQQGQGKGKRVISEGDELAPGDEDLMDVDEDPANPGAGGTAFLGFGGGRKRKGAKVANKRRGI